MKSCYWLVFGLFFGIHIPLSAEAQITVDGTTDTTLTPVDNGVRIDNGDRVGNNLFHSFDEFSIPDGGSASFNNATAIENIFSRVTGGNISNINGLISANGGANLLLINPAGIVFGENASLNIGGSFFATTADSLLFEDGEFSAVNPQAAPLLTINRPIGLNFGNSPGDIINRSNFGLETSTINIDIIPEFTVRNSVGLQVNDGETIALIGGDIILENAGGITASEGTVELGGLKQSGIVTLNPNGSFVFPAGVGRGNVILKEQARVNVTGSGGGFINVNAKNLELSRQSELFAGIAEDSGSETSIAGDININATESVKITGELDASTGENFEEIIQAFTFTRDYGAGIRNNLGLSSARRISDSNRSNAVGNGGDINITTATLELSNVAVIDTSIFGTGNGGDININADNIALTGSQSILLSQVRGFNLERIREQGIGDGGNLNINTGSISIRDGAGILFDVQPGAVGNGGAIDINASNSVDLIVEDGFSLILTQLGGDSVGSAGDIKISANSIRIDSFQLISNASNGSQGDGGNIILNAKEKISLDNQTLLLTQILEGAVGNAGDIEINADSLAVRDGSLILSDSQGTGSSGNVTLNIAETIVLEGISEAGFQSQIVAGLSRPSSQGTGGFIEINARELTLNDIAFITSNSVPDSVGSAGAIIINVDRLQLNENSLINVFTGNSDDGGSITINAKTLDLNSGGKILAATDGAGDAGSINLNISDRLTIDNSVEASAPFIVSPESPLLNDLQSEPSGIYANTTANSTGDGGNIVVMGIDRIPSEFTIANDAQIIASSEGTGSGGSIFLGSQSLELDNNATISASTNFERGGNVTLQIADNIILRNNSSISALATNDADGGNINIDTDLILAFTNQNNDIVANAQRGSGGNINITAEGILGIEERSSNPLNNTNDLDVSSDLSIDGTITINNPNVDRTSGLVELSTVPIDAEAILAQDLCRVENENVAGGSSFIITGRGGLTPTSAESLSNLNRVVEWTDVTELEVSDDGRVAVGQSPIQRVKQPNYRQSQGLMVADDGSLWLSADAYKTIPQNSTIVHPDCNHR